MKNRDLCSSLVTVGLRFLLLVASLLNSFYVEALKQIKVTRVSNIKLEKNRLQLIAFTSNCFRADNVLL